MEQPARNCAVRATVHCIGYVSRGSPDRTATPTPQTAPLELRSGSGGSTGSTWKIVPAIARARWMSAPVVKARAQPITPHFLLCAGVISGGPAGVFDRAASGVASPLSACFVSLTLVVGHDGTSARSDEAMPARPDGRPGTNRPTTLGPVPGWPRLRVDAHIGRSLMAPVVGVGGDEDAGASTLRGYPAVHVDSGHCGVGGFPGNGLVSRIGRENPR